MAMRLAWTAALAACALPVAGHGDDTPAAETAGPVRAPIYPLTHEELALILEDSAPRLQGGGQSRPDAAARPFEWTLHWSAPAVGDEPIPGEPPAWKPDTGLSLDFDPDREEVLLEWRVGF